MSTYNRRGALLVGLMEETDKIGTKDAFKDMFKYYKSKYPPPSLVELVDFVNNSDPRIENLKCNGTKSDDRCKYLGLTELVEWNTCIVKDKPGLIYIRNPFTAWGQRYWLERCLKEYPKKPNKTNIDNELDSGDWWSYCNECADNRKKLIKKLRWTTLGYHHDWDTKVYLESNRNIFPEDLADLCGVIASHLGYNSFQAQAAIVNYYHMDSTLSPHTDHSELNLEAPLISISFGQSAIFLIGGSERTEKPHALLLRSGDIVVMSKECRLSYHAVPKILPADCSPWDQEYDSEEPNFKHSKSTVSEDVTTKRNQCCADWVNVKSYISQARININVRQVLNENQKCLTDR